MRDPFDSWIERQLITVGKYFLPITRKVQNKVREWFTLPQPEKRKRKTNLAVWAEDEILEAASEALNHHLISADELIHGIRLLGKLSNWGIKPHDLDCDSLPDYAFYERLKQAVRQGKYDERR